MFEPNAEALDELIRLCELNNRTVTWRTGRGIDLDPPLGPKAREGYPGELLESLRPFLSFAFQGAVQHRSVVHLTPKGRPGMRPATLVYACDDCGNLLLQTKSRSEAKQCLLCHSKTPRRQVQIPWKNANRYGRPPAPEKGIPHREPTTPVFVRPAPEDG